MLLLLVPAICYAADPLSDSRTVLQKGLADSNPAPRREAAIAMSLMYAVDPVIDNLRSRTSDKDDLVRAASIATLSEIGDRKSIPLLRKALSDDVPEVVFAAARGLLLFKDPLGRSTLVSMVEGETKAESGYVSEKMRGVLRQMKTPKTAVLFAFRQGVGFIPVPGLGQGVSAAEALLIDSDFSGRANAVLSLGRVRDAASDKAVISGLKDEDWSVRAASVQSIGLWNQRSHSKLLAPLVEDRNEKVRFRAAACYLRLTRAQR